MNESLCAASNHSNVHSDISGGWAAFFTYISGRGNGWYCTDNYAYASSYYYASTHNNHHDLIHGHFYVHVNYDHQHDLNFFQYKFDKYNYHKYYHKLQLLDNDHVDNDFDLNFHHFFEHADICGVVNVWYSHNHNVDDYNNLNEQCSSGRGLSGVVRDEWQ